MSRRFAHPLDCHPANGGRRDLASQHFELGPNHLVVAIRLTNRALALKGLNRITEAESMLRRAINISEQNPNLKDLTPFVTELNSLGRVLQDFDRAISSLRKLLFLLQHLDYFRAQFLHFVLV